MPHSLVVSRILEINPGQSLGSPLKNGKSLDTTCLALTCARDRLVAFGSGEAFRVSFINSFNLRSGFKKLNSLPTFTSLFLLVFGIVPFFVLLPTNQFLHFSTLCRLSFADCDLFSSKIRDA